MIAVPTAARVEWSGSWVRHRRTVLNGLGTVAALLVSAPAIAETVDVKYRGRVNLESFDCTGALDSSVVKRVCHNDAHNYLLISLKGTWYHYCNIERAVVSELLAAESKGRFYNQRIKDSGTGGEFSCRDKPVPQF